VDISGSPLIVNRSQPIDLQSAESYIASFSTYLHGRFLAEFAVIPPLDDVMSSSGPVNVTREALPVSNSAIISSGCAA
jgi:hypothetical protein